MGFTIPMIFNDLGQRKTSEVNKPYDHIFRDYRDIEANPQRESKKRWRIRNKIQFDGKEGNDFNTSVMNGLRVILEIERKKIVPGSDEDGRILAQLDAFRTRHSDLPIRTIQNELRRLTGTDFWWPRIKKK